VVGRLGEAGEDTVPEAAAAGFAARNRFLVEEQRAHPAAGQRDPRGRAGGSAADDDDVRRGLHGCEDRRQPRQASAAVIAWLTTRPTTQRTETAPLLKLPATISGP